MCLGQAGHTAVEAVQWAQDSETHSTHQNGVVQVEARPEAEGCIQKDGAGRRHRWRCGCSDHAAGGVGSSAGCAALCCACRLQLK